MNATRDEVLYPVLTSEQIHLLKDKGEEIQLKNGDIVFSEGEPAADLYVVLEGKIRVTRKEGADERVIVVHAAGEFSGELSLLTGGICVATGRAEGDTRLLKVKAETFRSILGTCTPLTSTLVKALARRRQDVDLLEQQREKLASLGMMAAGLAHELNNPAGAALSATETLRETFHSQQALMLTLHQSNHLSPDQHAFLINFACEVTESNLKESPLDPIAQSDLEDGILDWLEAHEVANAYDLAPTFATSGMNSALLDQVAAQVDGETLCDVLAWLESMLKMRSLMDQIQSSTSRVAKLVTSVKKYTFMDQAPIQEIDVHEGLDDTLTMLGYKFKKANITVERQYAPNIPRICAYGSELNQAWTNLLINAIDALETVPPPRTVVVHTLLDGDSILVEIEDNGPGIPQAIQDRIFDPFFTTKDVGKGTGMGLDITQRIIAKRHHGEIRVTSQPRQTCFIIRLPIVQPKAQ